VRVSCSMTGFSTDDPKELCIGAIRLRFSLWTLASLRGAIHEIKAITD
jgi:hypothetical protein